MTLLNQSSQYTQTSHYNVEQDASAYLTANSASSRKNIPFNRPYMTGDESRYIAKAYELGHLSGDGEFTRACHGWLEKQTGANMALLTQSCTAALEMAAILADLNPGDEVIMPSYTFVSTANAFVLRGAVPVFVDCRRDNLNMDEKAIEAAITSRTRAIVPVHYAGVACDMTVIMALALRYGLLVIEDAAQAIMAQHKGRALGAIGHFGTFSFHETKNIISGEGGCLLINDPKFRDRAEIIREKGTNRSRFFRGEIDKYTWVDIGSSFLPSEVTAAFLWAQLQEAHTITKRRCAAWHLYHEMLAPLAERGALVRPPAPDGDSHNAHMYYILVASPAVRLHVRAKLAAQHISAVPHYVPLHTSPAGQQFGRASGAMNNTDELSGRLLRLPLWVGVDCHVPQIVKALEQALLSV